MVVLGMKLEAAKKYQSWIFQHDNAPAHTSMLVGVFLGKNKTINMPQPPYSPDLVPADFIFFPKVKTSMKGNRFAVFEEIKET